MELKNQVISLKIAKRLKELGVPQNGHFTWWWDSYMKGGRKSYDDSGLVYKGGKFIEDLNTARLVTDERLSVENDDGHIADHGINKWHLASAFTVAELGEMLPRYFESSKKWVTLPKDVDMWLVRILDGKYTKDFGKLGNYHIENGYTQADAYCKLLIYLLENNLIDNK